MWTFTACCKWWRRWCFDGDPVVTFAEPLSFSPAWLRNDMRRQAIMTPPATAMPQRMITPNVNATYIHDERLPANCVPNFDMRFETEDDAFEFYRKKVSLSRRTRTDHV